jgi:DNA-binding protein HU-beta
MRKCEVVRSIVNQTGIETSDVKLIVEAFLKTVKKEVGNGKRIELRGFGVFQPKVRKAKTGRDIARNIPIEVPQRVEPSFKPSKQYFTIKYKP